MLRTLGQLGCAVRLVVAYARFWLEFFQFVDRKLERAGVRVEGDVLEIHVDGGKRIAPKRIAKQAARSLALTQAIAGSRTLSELRHVAEMLTASVKGAVEEGWSRGRVRGSDAPRFDPRAQPHEVRTEEHQERQ